MNILVKYSFDKEECRNFKGMCVTANSIHTLSFDKGSEVEISGDEYLVKKVSDIAKKAGAKVSAEVKSEGQKEGTVDYYKAELGKLNVEFDENAKKADLKALYEEATK